MPEAEFGKDPFGSFRSESLLTQLRHSVERYWIEWRNEMVIPPYRPTNVHWETTFKALGWNRTIIEKFWVIFCRINRCRSGEISIFEFLNYFNLDRTQYVEKCFEYFDTTGGNDVDFLEFMVSVWNICTLDAQTLTNFTFDLYDLDSDGELTYPELEKMVHELFGSTDNARGKECLKDLTSLAEEKGGVITLESFACFAMNHSMILFPIFQIQRVVQTKVMGMKYWKAEIHRRSKLNDDGKHSLNPRHVQILLRTYKTGSVAAILTHTGDPNVALRNWFEENNEVEDNFNPVEDMDVQNKETKPNNTKYLLWNRARLLLQNQRKSKPNNLKSIVTMLKRNNLQSKNSHGANKEFRRVSFGRNSVVSITDQQLNEFSPPKKQNEENIKQSTLKQSSIFDRTGQSDHRDDKVRRGAVSKSNEIVQTKNQEINKTSLNKNSSSQNITENSSNDFTAPSEKNYPQTAGASKQKMKGPPIIPEASITNNTKSKLMKGPPIPSNSREDDSLKPREKPQLRRPSSRLSKKKRKKKQSYRPRTAESYQNVNGRPRTPGSAIFPESSLHQTESWLPPLKTPQRL